MPATDSAKAASRQTEPTTSLSSAPHIVRPSPGSSTFQPRSEFTTYTVPPRVQANNNHTATYSRNMLNHDHSPTRTARATTERSERNALEINNLKSVLRSDFQAVTSSLRASKKHYEDLNARFVAADKEQTMISHLVTAKLGDESKVSSLMAAKLLAEAESQELYAKRLRERVEFIEQQRIYDGPQMLELTASPNTTHHESTGAFELDAGHGATQMFNGSETSEDTVYTEAEPQQSDPGLYYSRNDSPSRLLQGRTYWLLEGHFEPFAPIFPGQHGAKLTALFNDSLTPQGDIVGVEDYANVPVFVCLKPGEGYTYMGQYSQPRYSDKLSYSDLFQHVPARVLEYWAKQLADPHRPAWITEQLVAHFWPPSPYTGPIPTDSALASPTTGVTEPDDPERVLEKRVSLALESYALKLKEWKKETQLKVTLLTESALMGMWDNSDTDEDKGLRLWWEYLECIGFDDEFYGRLVGLKKAEQQRGRTAATMTEIADLSTYSGDAVGMQSKRASKQRHDPFTSPVSPNASTLKPIKTKGPTLARSNRPAPIAVPDAYPQADLQAGRELHEATKAGDRKSGRSDKQKTLPLHARSVNK